MTSAKAEIKKSQTIHDEVLEKHQSE